MLTSRYDVYQDLMVPANFPKLNGIHGDWTTSGWPHDITIGADGQWTHGWGVKGSPFNTSPLSQYDEPR